MHKIKPTVNSATAWTLASGVNVTAILLFVAYLISILSNPAPCFATILREPSVSSILGVILSAPTTIASILNF